jgi:hypothetical protein
MSRVKMMVCGLGIAVCASFAQGTERADSFSIACDQLTDEYPSLAVSVGPTSDPTVMALMTTEKREATETLSVLKPVKKAIQAGELNKTYMDTHLVSQEVALTYELQHAAVKGKVYLADLNRLYFFRVDLPAEGTVPHGLRGLLVIDRKRSGDGVKASWWERGEERVLNCRLAAF